MLTLRNAELAIFRTDSDNSFNSYFNQGNLRHVHITNPANINQQNLINLIDNCISVCDNFSNRADFLFPLVNNANFIDLKNNLTNALHNAQACNYLKMVGDMGQANAARNVLINDLTQFTIKDLNEI